MLMYKAVLNKNGTPVLEMAKHVPELKPFP